MAKRSRRRAARRSRRDEGRDAPASAGEVGEMLESSPAPHRMRWKPTRAQELALFTVAVLAPYLAWLNNGFVYDDQVLIVARAAPGSVSEVLAVFGQAHHPSGLPYYRPLAALTLALQKALWGDAALAYHLLNLGLVLVLAFVMRGWFKKTTRAGALASLFAALLVVHPALSSTVHAIAGRETLLVTLFGAAACWAFQRPGRWSALLALACFAGALLSKEQAVVFPLVFIAADALGVSADSPVHKRGAALAVSSWAWATRHVPVLLVLALYFWIRTKVLAAAPRPSTMPITLAILDDPLGPLRSLLYTLQTVLMPTLDLSYEPRLPAWWSFWRAALSVLGMAGLGVTAFWLARGRAKLLVFWLCWTILTLLPNANIVSQETQYDERYVVLPLVGIVGIGATVFAAAWKDSARRPGLLGAALASIAGAALVSHHRGRFFADDFVFLTQWAKADPTSWQARASLAEWHVKRSELEDAVVHEREAVRLIHAGLREPWCIKRHFALADLLERTGRFDQAVAEYEEILRLKPEYSGARRKLARAKAEASSRKANVDGALDAALRARLLEGLRSQGAHAVWLAVTRTDRRSIQLGDELGALFGEAGWTVRARESVSFPVKPGLFLFAATEPAPAYVETLRNTLVSAGLQVQPTMSGYREYSAEMRAKNPAWNGFTLAPDQDYVLVVGRAAE